MIIWHVDNVKCGGCANRIRKKLQAIAGVTDVRVDVEQAQLYFDAPDERLADIEAVLLVLGYPRTGTTLGLAAVGADVRSVVSCAIGRFQSDADPL
jgi:copper chaperone